MYMTPNRRAFAYGFPAASLPSNHLTTAAAFAACCGTREFDIQSTARPSACSVVDNEHAREIPYDDTGYVAFKNFPNATLPGLSFTSQLSAGTYLDNCSIPAGIPVATLGTTALGNVTAATPDVAAAAGTPEPAHMPTPNAKPTTEATTERLIKNHKPHA